MAVSWPHTASLLEEAVHEAPHRYLGQRVPVRNALESVVDFQTCQPKADDNGEPLSVIQS
jgi:hypothetical protein